MPRTQRFATATYAATTATAVALLLSPGLGGVSSAETGGNRDPRRLAVEAQEGLQRAVAVRVVYVDRSATARSNRLPTSMNLALDRKGNCAGTMTRGGEGGTVEIVKRGKDVWLKPDAAFWRAELPGQRGIAAAKSFENRYVHGSTNDTLLSGLAHSCDLGYLERPATVTAPASLTQGLARMLDGRRVVPLSFEVNGLASTLYVTADKAHRLYRATQRGSGTNLALTFTEYGKPVALKTPAPSESVDMSKLRVDLQKA